MELGDPLQIDEDNLLIPKTEPSDFVVIKTEESDENQCFAIPGIVQSSDDANNSIKKEKTDDVLTDTSSSITVSFLTIRVVF